MSEEHGQVPVIDGGVLADFHQEDEPQEVPMSFPQKLMQVVSDPENADVISWLPHGKGFIIYKKKKFASDVLPKFFKQSKYTSFTRKLNRWGFTRVTRGPETGAYYHKYFQKDNVRLCMQMSCQSTKNATGNAAGKGYNQAADIQNQHVLRQQLQQLQMHQYQLQQMQMQQMQAQMYQQQQAAKSGDDDKEKDGEKPDGAASAPPILDPSTNPYLQMPTMGFIPMLQPGVFPGAPGMAMPQLPTGAMPMPVPMGMPVQAAAAPVAAEGEAKEEAVAETPATAI